MKVYSYRFLILILAATLLIFLVWKFNISEYLNFESINSFIEDSGIWAPLVFIFIYIVVVVSFLPASPLAILGGTIFGLWPATIYVTLGATLGATSAFIISRFFAKGFFEKITHGKFSRIHEYNRKVSDDGFFAVLVLRLIPLSPFKGPNYILGLSKIKFKDYVLATLIGMAPESFVFALIGSSLKTFSFWNIISALVLVIILLVISLLLKKV